MQKYVVTEKAEGGWSMALQEHKIASKNCRDNVLKGLKRNKPMCKLNMFVKMMQNSSQLIQLVIKKQATFF